MFCYKCGSQVDDDTKFCENCGSEQTIPIDTSATQETQDETIEHDMDTARMQDDDTTKKKSNPLSRVLSLVISLAVIALMVMGGEWLFSTIFSTDKEDGTGKQATDVIDARDMIISSSSEGIQIETTTVAVTTKTKITTTEAKSDSKTYSITFEADELIEEAGLQLGGHVGVAVLSNLTCSNGTANIETSTIYIYDSLVSVEVTGATAGEVVLSGTITTYGLDSYQGETVSYPDDSGVFLISKTVGEVSGVKPYIDAYVETYSNAPYEGSRSYLFPSGGYSYIDVTLMAFGTTRFIGSFDYNYGNPIEITGFNAVGANESATVSITPYDVNGNAGEIISCSIPESIDSKSNSASSQSVTNWKGQINCHGGVVAGFTTEYVVNGGATQKVRNSLGDTWHVTAKNVCTNYGITWYELWDSDDGDYYGWVDSNYIDFY